MSTQLRSAPSRGLPRHESDLPGAWDAFVRSAPGWTHFHLYGWRAVMEDVHGHQCHYLVERDARGAIIGVLPLVRIRSRLFGHALVSMPFLNYGGPLGESSAVQRLIDRAVELARTLNVDVLELRSRRALATALPVSHRKVTMLLPLPNDCAGLWRGFDAKLRSQIRRPAKAGVEYRFGEEHLKDFHRVYARHMRDLGTPAQPLSFYRAMAGVFGGAVWFGVGYLRGRPIAAGCGLQWDNELEISWASALVEHKQVAANMGLYGAFMERCIEAGVRTFNFGRCTPGGGTHRFKRQWGAQEEQLWWYGRGRQGGEAATAAHQSKWSWGPWLWRKLPLGLADALGPRIIRGIP